MTGAGTNFQQVFRDQLKRESSEDSIITPVPSAEPTTLGAHAKVGSDIVPDQASQPKAGSDTATFMPPIQVAEKDSQGLWGLYEKLCPYGIYWVPGFLIGSVGILLIVFGAVAMQDASGSEYVSTTCSLIEGTWQQQCNKQNQEATCTYTCAYVLESDVTGSERFGSSKMPIADILGTGTRTGCDDFSCIVDRRAAISDMSLSDMGRCGGGPCGPCSISGECSGCVGASLMKSEACSTKCSGLQTDCYAKQKDGKVHQLTLRSQDEEQDSARLLLVFGCIFAFAGLCCGVPCGIWCGMPKS